MIAIESETFNVDSAMALLGGVDSNFVLAGTWNKIPWRVWHHEPSDTLLPASWVLELGDHRFPLRQFSNWEQDDMTKSWEQAKSSWRVRTADGRWVMGDGCPPSETSAPTSPWIEMALTVEACHRLDLKRLFRSGRIGPGSTGSWREQRWRIDGPFLVMWGKRLRLVPAPRRNVRGVQWLLLVATGRRCTCLFMTPNGKVGTRWELELRYKSETLWMGKRLAHRRHKVIEKLDVPTDFKWVRDHPTYAPNTPKRTRWKTFRRLRKRLLTWRKQPELDDLKSLMGQLTRA